MTANLFLLGILLLSVCSNVESRLCQADKSAHNNSIIGTKNNGTPNMTDASLYLCPRPNDAQHLTECCFLDAIASCCERKHQDFISGIDDRILIVISIGVIISCALSVALVLVCCFWNKCPLYSTCGSSYQHNDTIAFTMTATKEEMMKLNGMPNEDYNLHLSKQPDVQVRRVYDDA